MNKNHWLTTARNGLRRALAGLLCLVLLLGLIPGLTLPVSAETTENWATPYLNQLVGWGVMRGDIDGNLYPERNITRAEFVTMMNRAYGYDKVGGNPFTDVYPRDWYYDDIDIAYNVGYFNGTSPTTASPGGELTREQAAVLLSRNMMLQGSSGETLGFSDSRELSEWSRGLVGAAAENGVIGGYGDGSFRPKNSITRGEVAAMLSRAVGSLINQPGSRSLGSVYGNLTINSSEVSLRNTAIVGNLYLTGGIGLGDVLLENVDVYGEIIVAGAGEANSSQSSVIMRNVTANELIVDNISNQFVTVRAEGNTLIPKASVRTNAYVEDTTPNGYGLSYIELDGEQGTRLQLAGNIKEVKNLTPMSSLEIVQGSASKVTSDEHATGSGVRIDGGARVDELNLDVGANVSGDGDIGTMNVGAAGTNVGILPDSITVRPGITSNITGTSMNNVTAAESSADPRLLSGYPAVRNVAPNSATLVFSTNKAGTVYWAVSALADGSVNEDDLITNPAYGGNIFRSGRINAASSKTEYTAQVSGLTVDGSYYVSAILVDSRGNHSPLKVTAFSTPDNTTPAFTSGYPAITRNTTKTAQVTVMTNKSCQMYYALLPRGASAPTAKEFKSGAVSGNLGYGVVDVVKNNTQPVNVNSVQLEELTNYTLYLWLNDYDNARSSGVRAMLVTTPDETPPVVTSIMQTDSKPAQVDINFTLNEPGDLYWAIVVGDNDTFMNYDDLSSTEAKIKVRSGSGAMRAGYVRASKADTGTLLRIGNLIAKNTGTTSYDVYYVAMDGYNNFAATVGKINVRTLDTTPPTVTQEFTEYNDDSKDEPLANTDIRLVFSERVQGGSKGEQLFLDLYKEVTKAGQSTTGRNEARTKLADALREHITMYAVSSGGKDTKVSDRSDPTDKNYRKDNTDSESGNESWTIDYRFAEVAMEEGKLVITLPTKDEPTNKDGGKGMASALNLASGASYYFTFSGIYDTALTPNAMGNTRLPTFRVVFARVSLSDPYPNTMMLPDGTVDKNNYTLDVDDEPKEFITDEKNDERRVDFNFVMDPISVDRVDQYMCWDMLLWTDTPMTFTLYSRRIDDGNETRWQELGSTEVTMGAGDTFVYRSVTRYFPEMTNAPDFTKNNLKALDGKKYEYAVHVDKIGDSDDFSSWNHNVTLRVSIVAGTETQLTNLSNVTHPAGYEQYTAAGAASIETPYPFTRVKPFTDTSAPNMINGWPTITVGDISAEINVMLDRPGSVYYIVFPLSQLLDGTTTVDPSEGVGSIKSFTSSVRVSDGSMSTYNKITGKWVPDENGVTGEPDVSVVPEISVTSNTTGEQEPRKMYNPVLPTVNAVIGGEFTSDVIKGSINVTGANRASTIRLGDRVNLTPNTVYYICMVTRGTSAVYSKSVTCYRFTTLKAVRPTINVRGQESTARIELLNNRNATIDYFLALNGNEGQEFQDKFAGWADKSLWKNVDYEDNKQTGGGQTSRSADDGDDSADDGDDDNQTSSRFSDGNYTFQYSKGLEKMTVIDAMATPCYRSDEYVGSVFDIYASTPAKNTYSAAIQSSTVSGNNIVLTDSRDFKYSNNGKAANNVECKTYMQPGVLYTFVAVGKSSEGSGYAFRAYYSLSKSDTTPPMVTSILFSGGITENGAKGTFTEGSKLIVNFSERLYAASNAAGMSTQDTIPLCTCASHVNTDPTNFKPIGSLGIAPIGFTIDTAKTHSDNEVTQLIFNLNKTADGATITFPSKVLCDQGRIGLARSSLSIGVKIRATPTTVTDVPATKDTPAETHVEYSFDVVLQTVTSAWRDSDFTTNMVWSGK